MFTDCYYTSYILTNENIIDNAILKNTKELPDTIIKPKLKKKSMIVYRKNNNLVLACKNKRIVILLTNWDNIEMNIVEKTLRHKFMDWSVYLDILLYKEVIQIIFLENENLFD